MSDKTITKFYEDSFPNSKGIVEWWGGFESEQVGEREYKYYGLDNPNDNWNKEIAELPEYKDMTYKLNRQGYRSDSFEDNKDSKQTKFLFIGCSATFGQGVPEDMMYSKVVANHFDAIHWNLSRVGNNSEGCLMALNNFLQAGYKADKVIIQYPPWSRQLFVDENEYVEFHGDVRSEKHRHWIISSNQQMNIWNWWLITKAVKGICLENNLDLVEIIVQKDAEKYLPNAIDFVPYYYFMGNKKESEMFARDGVHPGKLSQELFAKAVIDYIKNNKKQDPVLDILQNPLF